MRVHYLVYFENRLGLNRFFLNGKQCHCSIDFICRRRQRTRMTRLKASSNEAWKWNDLFSFNDKLPNHTIVRQTADRRKTLAIASGIIPPNQWRLALWLWDQVFGVFGPPYCPSGKVTCEIITILRRKRTLATNQKTQQAGQPALFSHTLDNSRCIPKQTRSALFFEEVRRFSARPSE